MSEKKIVIIADASEEFRQMLSDAMEQTGELTVAAQTDNGETLLSLISRIHPDVVVMDLMLSELDGLDVLEQLGEDRPNLLVLSAFSNPALRSKFLLGAAITVCSSPAVSRLSLTEPASSAPVPPLGTIPVKTPSGHWNVR